MQGRGSDVHWQNRRTKGRDWEKDLMDLTLAAVSAWSEYIILPRSAVLSCGVDYRLPVSTDAPL